MTSIETQPPAGADVVCAGLVHVYPSEQGSVAALRNADLVVKAGEMLAIVGSSGSVAGAVWLGSDSVGVSTCDVTPGAIGACAGRGGTCAKTIALPTNSTADVQNAILIGFIRLLLPALATLHARYPDTQRCTAKLCSNPGPEWTAAAAGARDDRRPKQ